MKEKYYLYYPRNFANEYDIFVVSENKVIEKLVELGAKRITKKEAHFWGVTRLNQAKKQGEQWYGGFVSGQAMSNTDWTDDNMVKEALISDTIDYLQENRR